MALYRKYRPATFAEVVGQEHVTDPLCTALDTGRISHAYLFSGPRGCGKTSSARILARSLNCVEGPTSTPCGTCASCVSLGPGGGGNLDVIELDAASHGGVDDTRELRDRAFYAPAESRYRVFIVDEAHMVTTAGFNALLKIVEEPPAHLIFVFATTEPEKVLPTIRSRTHHYPFRLLPPATMRGLLGDICEQEHVPVEEAVYPLVIRAGGGSPRDSLSVLDQLLAGAGSDGVTYTRAVALLGVTDVALIDEAVDALAGNDGAAMFGTVDRVMEAGHDPRRFAVDLLERLRDLILMQAVPDATERGLVAAPGDLLDRMRDQASRLGPGTLTRCAELLHAGLGEMRGATAPRLLLEVVCSRMLLPAADVSDAATLQRLEQLERRVASGAVAAPAEGSADSGLPPGREVPAPSRPAADPSRRRGAEALAALRGAKASPEGPTGDAAPDGKPAVSGARRSAADQGQRVETSAAATVPAEAPGARTHDEPGTGNDDRPAADAPPAGPPRSADPTRPGTPDAVRPVAANAVHSDVANPTPGTADTVPPAGSGVADSGSADAVRPGAADTVRPAGSDAARSGAADTARPDAADVVRPAGPGTADSGAARAVRPDAVDTVRPAGSDVPSDSAGGARSGAADAVPPAGSGTAGPGAADSVRPGVSDAARGVSDARSGVPGGGASTRPAADEGDGGRGPAGGVSAAGGEAAAAAEPGSPAAETAGPESGPDLLSAVEAAWPEIKVKVREFGTTIGAMLTSGASVAGVEQGEIVLAHHAALVQRLSQPQPLAAVRSAVAAVLGHEHPVRWVVAGQQVSRGPGGRERGGRRSGDADSGDSEGGRRGGPKRTWTGRPGSEAAGSGDSGAGPEESTSTVRGAGGAGPESAGQSEASGRDSEPGRATGAPRRTAAAPPRFSRPSQARGTNAAAAGNPYDDIPPPDYPDLPDDPGPEDYGYGSGAVPPATPEEEQEMLADAARPAAPGERRDPDEVALELLASELGATPLNG
ncbi:DNA polymerase III subunit gamma and tau [Nocardia sp. NPDC051750]|uniref:DNA polymerase III subunit gamma and tau n=1 Tax=Nocardia sp. NPDC051750 TaxID=3364325 RepID=UPI00378DF769